MESKTWGNFMLVYVILFSSSLIMSLVLFYFVKGKTAQPTFPTTLVELKTDEQNRELNKILSILYTIQTNIRKMKSFVQKNGH